MFYDMTFPALAKRAAEVKTRDSVTDHLDNGDTREVTVFLDYDQINLGEDYGYKIIGKEVIGVALCDPDDPQAAVEILTRDQAGEMFGWQRIEDWESME